MGLDAVELVLRAEEFFTIFIPDNEAAAIRTVHDFYTVICRKLNVTPAVHPTTPDSLPIITKVEKLGLIRRNYKHLPPPPELLPWTADSVWSAVVALFVDQLNLKPEEVLPDARIVDDLGID